LLTIIDRHGDYGGLEDDEEELLDQSGNLLEKIAFHYRRDQAGNWVERLVSILDPATHEMVDIRLDKRELTYY